MAENTKTNTDGTLKRVHTEVSDSSLSGEEPMPTPLGFKKSKVVVNSSWPRFLLIASNNERALQKMSPFGIHKALVGLAGEPKTVKKLRNGTLLVEVRTESHAKCLLKSRMLCNIDITVTAHSSLNSSRGVIRSRDLEGVSDEEICGNLASQGVAAVRRISVRRNDISVPTNTLILTFSSPTLPQSIKAGYLCIAVEPFIPNPLRCFKCQRFGHGQVSCRNKMTCARCGQADHDSKECKLDLICINCKGTHFAYSRECPKWKVEKRVQQLKVQNHLSFIEARKLVEASSPAASGKSYAAVAGVSNKAVECQTDLTWLTGGKPAVYTPAPSPTPTPKKKTMHSIMTQTSFDCPTLTINSPTLSGVTSTGAPGPKLTPITQPNSERKKATKDRSSGRLKKFERQLVPTGNAFELLDQDVEDMDIPSTSTDQPPPKRPPAKPKERARIIPVLPPDGK